MKFVIFSRLIISSMAVVIIPSTNAAVANGTFEVQIQILKSCSVTAGSGSNINLGSVNASAINTSGSNTISVNCSKTTPYFIGLAPSNNNTLGAGTMASTTDPITNVDRVPYQLNQTSATGPVWGNTATTSSVGNGVAGIGTGAAQTLTVYATVANADFIPDSYADTVTVNVNY